MRRRIDVLLVERGLVETRQKAQALLLAGRVWVDEQRVDKPGHLIDVESKIRITEQLLYVSRGGLKLKAAVDHFQIPVNGRYCVDLGASTGGFTDCLLQHGALEVHAFDVGRGQMDWKLRNDPRVIIRDQFNVRYITAKDLPAQVSLITADLSFISLGKILEPLKNAILSRYETEPESCGGEVRIDIILLVKPQFEVGKGQVGKGGIVRDAPKRHQALEMVGKIATQLGYRVMGSIPSPILGAKGNQEFLMYLQLCPGLSSSP
jgi:23S rRNA (cytidine1920-2'-O)/16S rRNA (cytidine1409-2'-O)-methyltransferase